MKWCSTCRSRYRGSFSVHASTAKHRAHLRGPARRGTRRELDQALGYVSHHIGRALAGDRGDDMSQVRKHRRRPPLDGPRRIVAVRRYFRRRPSWIGGVRVSIAEQIRRGWL